LHDFEQIIPESKKDAATWNGGVRGISTGGKDAAWFESGVVRISTPRGPQKGRRKPGRAIRKKNQNRRRKKSQDAAAPSVYKS